MAYNTGFFREMSLSKALIAENKNKEAGKIWVSVRNIACKGNYSSYKNASRLATLSLEGYHDSYIATTLKVGEDTVRWHRRNLSNELFKLLGNDFFSLLKNFIISGEGLDLLESRVFVAKNLEGCASDFLCEDVLVMMNKQDFIDGEFTLEDCSDELVFLQNHCKAQIKSEYSVLSKSKLSYLIGVLNSQCGSVDDRYKLIKALSSQEG